MAFKSCRRRSHDRVSAQSIARCTRCSERQRQRLNGRSPIRRSALGTDLKIAFLEARSNERVWMLHGDRCDCEQIGRWVTDVVRGDRLTTDQTDRTDRWRPSSCHSSGFSGCIYSIAFYGTYFRGHWGQYIIGAMATPPQAGPLHTRHCLLGAWNWKQTYKAISAGSAQVQTWSLASFYFSSKFSYWLAYSRCTYRKCC